MLPCDDLFNDTTDLPLPSLEALLAGTMVLMTAWAAPCAQARVDQEALRRLLARKVQSNLFFLRQHPQVSPALGRVVQQMQPAWLALAGVPEPGTAAGVAPAGLAGSLPVCLH